jgi:hypothetical protein
VRGREHRGRVRRWNEIDMCFLTRQLGTYHSGRLKLCIVIIIALAAGGPPCASHDARLTLHRPRGPDAF